MHAKVAPITTHAVETLVGIELGREGVQDGLQGRVLLLLGRYLGQETAVLLLVLGAHDHVIQRVA